MKFEIPEDRNRVYDARFPSDSRPRHNLIIQENLSLKRAKQVKKLSDLKKGGSIGSYHTRNGNIYARASIEQRYAQIDPDWSEAEICEAVHGAPSKQYTQHSAHRYHRGAAPPDMTGATGTTSNSSETIPKGSFSQSQTIRNIPPGHVNNRLQDLEDFVVPRDTRSTRKVEQERKRAERGQSQN